MASGCVVKWLVRAALLGVPFNFYGQQSNNYCLYVANSHTGGGSTFSIAATPSAGVLNTLGSFQFIYAPVLAIAADAANQQVCFTFANNPTFMTLDTNLDVSNPHFFTNSDPFYNAITINPGSSSYCFVTQTKVIVVPTNQSPQNAIWSISATIPLPGNANPQAIVIRPDGQYAYVTCYNLNKVFPINTDGWSGETEISVGTNPTGIAASPDGKWIYVANSGSNNISVIDTTHNTIHTTVSLPAGLSPSSISFSPDSTKAYVATTFSSSTIPPKAGLQIVDTTNYTVTSMIDTNYSAVSGSCIVTSADGTLIYVSTAEDGNVSKIIAFNTTSPYLPVAESSPGTGGNMVFANFTLNSSTAFQRVKGTQR